MRLPVNLPRFATLLFLFSLLMLQQACDSDKSAKSSHDSFSWSQYITSHSSGIVSKRHQLRIRFVNDVINEDQVGADASDVVSLSPSIKGKLVYASKREIVLTPETELPSGEKYEVSLDTESLKGMAGADDEYEFSFQVIRQDFEIKISGLNISSNSDKDLMLNGVLETADHEAAEKIEKMLQARYMDKEKVVQWQHDVAGKQHRFSIDGLTRQSKTTPVKLSWNGSVIGVDNEGSQDEDIPAKGIFKVNRIRAVQADRQYIQVEFSDQLKPGQNLRGLLKLGDEKFTTRIESNLLKIYPDSTLQDEVILTLNSAIRNKKGGRLNGNVEKKVAFTSMKPQIRFVGKGVILPQNDKLSIPFESVNVDSVQLTAFLIYENNIGQFLQGNKLDGSYELGRVGRYLWRKTIRLDDLKGDSWNRHGLDASELLKSHPGAMIRLSLAINRSNSTYSCTEADNQIAVPPARPMSNNEDLNVVENSGWDGIEEYTNANSGYYNWQNRDNPCKDEYYRFSNSVTASRNFLASNIGLIAKRDGKGNIHVVSTNLASSEPLSGVEISLHDFQDQVLASTKTDKNGFALFKSKRTPFYLRAHLDDQVAYLKMNKATALPVSHFDVGGDKVEQGIKGYLYGERGVWRPGDDIHLTFALQDKDEQIPDQHPVTVRLLSPKGQVVQTLTSNESVGDLYSFKLKTADDAPTGNWTVKAQLGGSTFSKTLKIETVVPNRLKVNLDFGRKLLKQVDMPIKANLSSEWLHGAKASELKADVAVRMTPRATGFDRFTDYVFDDPAREFRAERQTLFEGHLDKQGIATFERTLSVEEQSPGMLNATFISRVFEQGGAFSADQITVPYSPYPNYVGIKLPKGDATRGMLLTDINHRVEVVSMDADGKSVPLKQVQVSLYKVNWKWWWDKSGDSLAQYASAYHRSRLQQGTIATDKDGRGSWEFEIKHPEWGRYLIRACDLQGNHCTGKTVYIDWPGWAGRAQEGSGAGASVLSFYADKKRYQVGETATIQLPEATQGRALVSIENGSEVLQQSWHEFSKQRTSFKLPITASMAPNVYVHVTLVQPHAGKNNDRPIRLYGVIPLLVDDPATRLKPKLTAADEWEPEARVSFSVSEEQGHAMAYTVAVVDEGLLGLTRFRTPDLHGRFYRKEALGVNTWDMFDDVVGAYGGELERLLALGGGDSGEDKDNAQKKRFPPVVKFFGPFKLEAGKTRKHEFELPQYMGAVRVMLVAADKGAYGHTDKSVFVRKPLGMLATLPRVVGPQENISVPVAMFVTEPSIKEVTLKIEADDHFEVVGNKRIKLHFDGPGDKLGVLRLKTGDKLGKAKLHFSASSGKHKSETTVYIDVRSANPLTTRIVSHKLEPGESWQQRIEPYGLVGTNKVSLEVSAVPPINLGERMAYLIRYPHGCIEQVTSSVFPQLYLGKLMKLQEAQKKSIERNVNAAIARLRQYQNSDGGFAYWPGQTDVHAWGTNYAGHFLLEARRSGYVVPAEMLNAWLDYQKSVSSSWLGGSGAAELDQAYRLYTLALANEADMGAMNRLREASSLQTVSRWQLAAAYQLSGLNGAASQLVEGIDFEVPLYLNEGHTLGSALRDKAIILNTLVAMGRSAKAQQLVEEISDALSAQQWHSTQTVAYSLLAMSKYIVNSEGVQFNYSHQLGKTKVVDMAAKAPIQQSEIKGVPLTGETLTVKNYAKRSLYAQLILEGVPRAGEEKAASSEMAIDVRYFDRDGRSMNIDRLQQGSDIMAIVRVRNNSKHDLENIALTHIVPAGWEIHNARFSGTDVAENAELDYQDIRDDRLYSYFPLKAGEEKSFTVLFNAAYLGRYYLPSVSAEAMYDANKHARTKGQWIEVIKSKN